MRRHVLVRTAALAGALAVCTPAQSQTPPGSPAEPEAPRVRILITSLGGSTGEVLEAHIINDGPVPVTLDVGEIVVEPLRPLPPAAQQLILDEARQAGRNVVTVKLNAYCLEFLRLPPNAGALLRIASPAQQETFAPMRRILAASRHLRDAGALAPDSDPDSYFHSIRQWAIWTREQGFDEAAFGDAFVNHTRKAFAEAGQRWTADVERVLRGVVPNRWRDIQRVLQEADRTEGPADRER